MVRLFDATTEQSHLVTLLDKSQGFLVLFSFPYRVKLILMYFLEMRFEGADNSYDAVPPSLGMNSSTVQHV